MIDIKIHEYEKGLVWDENDEFIDQGWGELKEKIKNTHGGIGIIAADFDELLRFWELHQLSQPERRRTHFAKLVENAQSDEDIELLSEILSIILIKPWRTNLQAGWFIYYLRKGKNLELFDVDRACRVLNELWDIHEYATKVLIFTLESFIWEDTLVRELLNESIILRKELRHILNPAKVFISYSRIDKDITSQLRKKLDEHGLKVWMDTEEILPGEKWKQEIRNALEKSEFVIVCFSEKSIMNTEGYFYDELKIIREIMHSSSQSVLFCIPIAIDDFDRKITPNGFEENHILDLYEDMDITISKIRDTIIKFRSTTDVDIESSV
ncbi:toll/interleukin-1 receptor domain-containing protein [Paenibacillus sp. MMS20-IR301]|uniref:toll/interleukin-1 receptor domain-containing protein n=1 Tax=Paenibacillus sp. MMS20-IR301 TaxID=2895946 RepID=UPI0028E79F6E|nr:toll/interleukin-1 receptor domain-containing protein [Paenibacillus sp. MMS20-IR301]WNS42045.1 toll/interleukin-1 receptor domain-containing protein [Paenibacillus sp. MMS20-IR301]